MLAALQAFFAAFESDRLRGKDIEILRLQGVATRKPWWGAGLSAEGQNGEWRPRPLRGRSTQ